MAIPLHSRPAYQLDVSMDAAKHGTNLSRVGRWKVDGRVDVMTTLVATLPIARTAILAEPAIESCSCRFALTGHGETYNEQAFHHFLAIEHKRSEASTRPFMLLLVELEKHGGLP